MTDLSPENLATLRALCDAATPGPWGIRNDDDVWCLEDDGYPNAPMFEPNRNYRRWGRDFTPQQRQDDAALIAAARTALPALLDEVERLTAACEESIDDSVKIIMTTIEIAGHENAELKDLVDTLRAENERLRCEILELERVLERNSK